MISASWRTLSFEFHRRIQLTLCSGDTSSPGASQRTVRRQHCLLTRQQGAHSSLGDTRTMKLCQTGSTCSAGRSMTCGNCNWTWKVETSMVSISRRRRERQLRDRGLGALPVDRQGCGRNAEVRHSASFETRVVDRVMIIAGSCRGRVFFCDSDCLKEGWREHKEKHHCHTKRKSAQLKYTFQLHWNS